MDAAQNPFRSERVTQLTYRLDGTTWPALLERLAALNYRAAIVGPYGSGKTCLLRHLATHLEALGFTPRGLRLREDVPPPRFEPGFFDALGPHDLVLIDEADQLPHLAWRRFKRRSQHTAGMIVTAHRRGLLPTLIRCDPGPEVLGELVVELLGEELPHHRATIAALHRRHRGNLRAAFHELYDRYAAQ